jgi:probable O-glycosylation ligase (exosortase A-associated)
VLIVLAVGIPAAFFNTFYALLLYVWWAVFRPEFFAWYDLTPYRFSLILGLILLVPSLIQGAYPDVKHPLSIGLLVFLGVALLSQFTAFDVSLGWQWLDYFSRLVCVSLLTVTLVDTRQKFFWVIAIIGGSFGFYASKAGLASLIGGGVQFAEGLTGSFGDNNGYALGIAIVLPFLIAIAQNASSRWVRLGFYASAPLSAFCVVSLFSRGGLLGMGAAAVVLGMFQKKRIRFLAAMAAVVYIGIYYAPIPEGWFDRMQTIQTYDETDERSAEGRLYFWGIAINMALDRPLGVGLKNFEAAYDRYDTSEGEYGSSRAVHSSHFQVLAETGFPGAAVWVSLFGMAFFFAFRTRRRARDPELSPQDRHFILTMSNALIASMVGFLIGGAFLSAALNDITWLTFGLIASLDRISLMMCAEARDAVASSVPAPAVAVTHGRSLEPAFSLHRRP